MSGTRGGRGAAAASTPAQPVAGAWAYVLDRYPNIPVEHPQEYGGGRVFSHDASSGLLATRWRLWRQSDSSALRSAFVV